MNVEHRTLNKHIDGTGIVPHPRLFAQLAVQIKGIFSHQERPGSINFLARNINLALNPAFNIDYDYEQEEKIAARYLLMECLPISLIRSACTANPTSRICSIQAALSDRKMKPNSFDMKLLNFRQFMGSSNAVQSAQES
jgi:hypothetical protein